MESKFNRIKKLIQGDSNQPLPPELGWNNMKDGIFDKIRSLEQEESSHNKKENHKRRFMLFFFLFNAFILCLFFVSQSITKNQNSDTAYTLQLPTRDLANNPPNNTGEQAHTMDRPGQSLDKPTQTNGLQAGIGQIAHPSDKPFAEIIGKLNVHDLELTLEESETNQVRNQEQTTSQSAPIGNGQLPEYQPLNQKEIPTNYLNSDRLEFTESMQDTGQNTLTSLAKPKGSDLRPIILSLQSLPTHGFDQIPIEHAKNLIFTLPILDSVVSTRSNRRISPNSFILEGGITFWNEGYRNNKPERALYETPIGSFQIQGHYMKSFKKDYFVMAGLQYQQLESRFLYNSTIHDYKIILEDTIIQVKNNLLTGEQHTIRGNVEQLVKAERRIRHYNMNRLFKVSLAVGKSWRFNSLQTDVYFGGALNSLVQNQGRILHEDMVIDYVGTSNPIFKNQWTVDATLGVRLHYFLSEKISMTSGLQTQKSLMNWSTQDDIRFHPFSLSFQLGLSYSL